MTSAITKSIGILRASRTSLFLCDMQEKFRPNIKFFDEVVANSSRVLKAASVMEIPVLATEQYPKGLGPTVPELGLIEANVKAYPKTCFSMVLPELMNELRGNLLIKNRYASPTTKLRRLIYIVVGTLTLLQSFVKLCYRETPGGGVSNFVWH